MRGLPQIWASRNRKIATGLYLRRGSRAGRRINFGVAGERRARAWRTAVLSGSLANKKRIKRIGTLKYSQRRKYLKTKHRRKKNRDTFTEFEIRVPVIFRFFPSIQGEDKANSERRNPVIAATRADRRVSLRRQYRARRYPAQSAGPTRPNAKPVALRLRRFENSVTLFCAA